MSRIYYLGILKFCVLVSSNYKLEPPVKGITTNINYGYTMYVLYKAFFMYS